MPTKKMTFTNSIGHRLAGNLETPNSGKPIAYALFAHCFTCSKDYKAVAHISRRLAQEGIAVLRFDFTGLGESEGEFAETNFSSNVDDIIAAAAFLEREYDAPQLLIGHSLGGTAMLRAAAKIPSSVAVVTIASPFEPQHIAHHLGNVKGKILTEGEAEVLLSGRPFTLKKQFIEDAEQINMTATIRNLNRALLILHSPVDKTLHPDHAARIFQTARHPKSFISLDQADHLLSDHRDAIYVADLITVWSKKYL